MVHMGKRGFLMNGDQVNEHAKEVAKELNVIDHRAHPSTDLYSSNLPLFHPFFWGEDG